MPLPTERISLNQTENAAIRAGLDPILNGFAEINAGLRRAPEVLNSSIRDKFKPRVLDDDSYAVILDLRNRLAAGSGRKSTSHRLHCIEYAIVAFAVRVGGGANEAVESSELKRKIENHRKRAKRKAISQLGSAAYQSAHDRWRLSLNWIHYYVLPIRLPRDPAFKLRLQREQYVQMFTLAKGVLTVRCTELPPDELISKFVKLAIAEIRRHRHPGIKVRELIQDPIAGKEFLFKFIEKRMDKRGTELQLKFEYMPRCVQAAIRTEKFKTAMVIDESPAQPVSRTQATVLPRLVKPIDTELERSIFSSTLATSKGPAVRLIVTPQNVSDWLIEDVERGYWEDLINEAKYQMDLQGIRGQQTVTSTNLAGIIEETRPSAESSDAPEHIATRAEWLLSWTQALEKDTVRLRDLFVEGLRMATAPYKPLDNPPHRINGVRYIQGIMDGTLRS